MSIKFLMERLPLTWVLQNQQTFLKALLFVMMDLTGEVRDGRPAEAAHLQGSWPGGCANGCLAAGLAETWVS